MPNYDTMPIKELRKCLKDKRGGEMKSPAKMKRGELMMEILGSAKHGSMESAPAPAPVESKKKEEAPVKKPAAKKAPVAKAEPEPVSKALPKATAKAAAPASEPVKRLVAGSQEARDKMAALRAKRSGTKNVE